MNLISYAHDGRWRAGFSENAALVPVAACGVQLSACGSEARSLLEAGPDALKAAAAAARKLLASGAAGTLRLEELAVGPPVPDPDKILCLGLNYFAHVGEVSMEVPKAPILFPKFRNSLVGPADPIRLPASSREIDFEGELAVVIGRRCKDVSEQDAMSCVAGYACFNDVSARDVQFVTSQWTAGKALDTFAPMGPGMALAEDISDPQNLLLTTRVNGDVMQQASTALMMFSVAATIAFISSLMTLEPGDVIATGTPAGVGFTRRPPVYLKPGDTVEVEIERVGTIRNPVRGAVALEGSADLDSGR
ncbi:FAA hydrolase family protein [bacterium]|nr:MAG: FAA hydrolase family protein [bacterium]